MSQAKALLNPISSEVLLSGCMGDNAYISKNMIKANTVPTTVVITISTFLIRFTAPKK